MRKGMMIMMKGIPLPHILKRQNHYRNKVPIDRSSQFISEAMNNASLSSRRYELSLWRLSTWPDLLLWLCIRIHKSLQNPYKATHFYVHKIHKKYRRGLHAMVMVETGAFIALKHNSSQPYLIVFILCSPICFCLVFLNHLFKMRCFSTQINVFSSFFLNTERN